MTSKPRSVKKLPAIDNELSGGSPISEKKRKDTSNVNPLFIPQGWGGGEGGYIFQAHLRREGRRVNRDRRLI